MESSNFIENIIEEDIKNDKYDEIITRFPPEPNGYLHLGHARNILLNYNLANKYNGIFHFRFDDTNPTKEKEEFANAILNDIKWLGIDYGDKVYYASDYFNEMYEGAIKLIKKGLAYVCELSADEIREYRGTLTEPGKDSPYRNRSVDENLKLFIEMKEGKYQDGSKVLRAKIDMKSPNINMRDPVIYRILHKEHYKSGDNWCVYPMYTYAHPVEDAIEKISHSICTLEFEDQRPFYEWVVNNLEYDKPPVQIECAKLVLKDVIMGKRYMKKLVEENYVDGWDDPRMATISGLRRRGYTKDAIRQFVKMCGVSKANSITSSEMLEYCIREDLKLKKKRVMAIIDPIKLVITNYEKEEEWLPISNNSENEELGMREIPFSKELYIEREDFEINPPKKYHRLYVGNEVRLMGAYFVKCTGYDVDESGKVTTVYCTYDEETKSGSGFNKRKVKGTIHFVSIKHCIKAEARIYDNLVDEEQGIYDEEGNPNINKNSLIIKDCYVEPSVSDAKILDSYQFLRNGFFCVDSKYTTNEKLVFNRIVSLKSSYKPE